MSTPHVYTTEIARQLREFYTDKNWTWVWWEEVLADVTWKDAIVSYASLNSIATLVYHIHYYFDLQVKVMQGGPLDGHDKDAFRHPPVDSEADWQHLLQTCRDTAMQWAMLVEQLPDEQLTQPFRDGHYGNWFRNLSGAIEHAHYHLGQIVLLKKLMAKH